MAQPAIDLVLTFAHAVVLRQQLAAAMQKVQHLEGEIGFPGMQAGVLQFLVEGFQLGPGQFVLLGLEAEAGHGQLPEEALASAVSGLQSPLE